MTPSQPTEAPAESARRFARSSALWFALIILVVLAIPLQYAIRYTHLHNFAPEVVEASKQNGEVVIAALRDAHAKSGRYPETLDGLLSALPAAHARPQAGEKRCRYDVSADGSTCKLSFKVRGPNYYNWYAESAAEFRWEMDR
jgi:hypothetical protein